MLWLPAYCSVFFSGLSLIPLCKTLPGFHSCGPDPLESFTDFLSLCLSSTDFFLLESSSYFCACDFCTSVRSGLMFSVTTPPILVWAEPLPQTGVWCHLSLSSFKSLLNSTLSTGPRDLLFILIHSYSQALKYMKLHFPAGLSWTLLSMFFPPIVCFRVKLMSCE